MAKYYVISCHVLWRELCYYSAFSDNIINLQFLEQGLHNTPAVLREKLQLAIDAVDGDYDAILLGYGLCCEGLDGIMARDKKLVVMKGHDCITFLLGSRTRFKDYFADNPGTYWYSPGWIDTGYQPGKERNERETAEYIEKYGEDNASYLMEMEQNWFKEYKKATYVDLGFADNINYKEYTKDCADYLKWEYEELKGDPKLIVDFLGGNWDNNNYLAVQPGDKIVASHDDDVIKAV